MKKTLLLLGCSVFMSLASSAQDTIVAWTFPSSLATPVSGLAINNAMAIQTENDARAITFTTGQATGDTAATAIGWNNGVMDKCWMVKFKTTGYTNIKISSKQRAGNQNGGGPRDFLIQWTKGTPTGWANIINDTIRCGNNWNGAVSNAALPSGADTSTSDIFVRWVVATDSNITGTAINAAATAKIDDIIVTGTQSNTGLSEVLFSADEINIYPNPSTGLVTISSSDLLKSVIVYNQLGAVVFEQRNPATTSTIDLSAFGRGIYFISLRNKAGELTGKKVVIL